MKQINEGPATAHSRQTRAAAGTQEEGFALRNDVNTRDPYVRSLADTVNDAWSWCERNPGCWGFIVSRCRELVAAGRHFSFRMVLEEARYHAAPQNGDELFKLPNEYAPILCRAACAEVPGMADLVSVRRCKYDEVLPPSSDVSVNSVRA